MSSAAFRHPPPRSNWQRCCYALTLKESDSMAPKIVRSHESGLSLKFVLDPFDPLFTVPAALAARPCLKLRRRYPLVARRYLVKRSEVSAVSVNSISISMHSTTSSIGTPVSVSRSPSNLPKISPSRAPSVRNLLSPPMSPSTSVKAVEMSKPADSKFGASQHSLHSSSKNSSPASVCSAQTDATTVNVDSEKHITSVPMDVPDLVKTKSVKSVLSRFADDEIKSTRTASPRAAPRPFVKPAFRQQKQKSSKYIIHRQHTNPMRMRRLMEDNTFGKLSLHNAHETLTVDFKPCLQHPQLQQLQLSVWFRVLQLALLFLMGALGNLAPVSLMSWWLLALVGVPTVSSQVPLFTQVDSVLLRRIVVMFDFHFTFFSSSLFLLGSIARNVLAFDALSAGSDVSMSLLVLWRMFGCVSLIFALMRVQCQDALLLDRAEKLWASWSICLSSLCFWLFSRAIVATIDNGLEPSLCTPSGACFTLQRIRLDTLMSSIVFAGNCLRCLVFNADRFCMIKSTISLNVMTREIATNGKKKRGSIAAARFSFSSKSTYRSKRLKLHGVGSNAMLVTSSSRLVRRYIVPKDEIDSSLQTVHESESKPMGSFQSSRISHDKAVSRLRLSSRFLDEYGSTSFLSLPMFSISIPHSVWFHWACAAILVTLYLLQEPRSSWIAFAGVLLLFGCWVVIVLRWFHRSTMQLLMRNFEWWYLFCLCAFFMICSIYEASSPQYVAVVGSGIVGSDGKSLLAVQTTALVFWSALLCFFNIAVISSDALISPSRYFKLGFTAFNSLLNIGIAFYLCFSRNDLEIFSPSLCVGAFCNSLFSLQIQSMWVISLFSLKYCVYLWYIPNALLVLRAPITVSSV